MRESKITDFLVELEGIGQFVFAKRNMREEVRCSVELRRLTEGVAMDEFTMTFLRCMADLKVLTVEAPDGWRPDQLDDLDPFDETVYARTMKVWEALRDKEETFRANGKALPQGGEGAGGDV